MCSAGSSSGASPTLRRVPRHRRGMPSTMSLNGSLFKPDPILDDLAFSIDDAANSWPQTFQSIANYDFRHEVTVDVLGRIFERSITDIEKIKGEGLAEHEKALAAEGRRTGRRKAQGVYYTDAAITEYLVAAALDPLWEPDQIGGRRIVRPRARFARAAARRLHPDPARPARRVGRLRPGVRLGRLPDRGLRLVRGPPLRPARRPEAAPTRPRRRPAGDRPDWRAAIRPGHPRGTTSTASTSPPSRSRSPSSRSGSGPPATAAADRPLRPHPAGQQRRR